MGNHSQSDRAFRFDTPLGEDELLLEGFSGQEPVSAPFHYTLELLSEDDSIKADDLLGQPVSFSVRLADDSDRYFHGVVNRFLQHGKSEDLTSYEVEVVPWLWFLSLSRDCRVFQNMTAPDIIEEIFGKYSNADYQLKFTGSYPEREYCVQYRESDLNFVSRLMEEEGIFYSFEHSADGHKLTLVDDLSMIDPCPVQSEFQVATTPEAWLEEDVITELWREHEVNTERVTLRDYDYLKPTNDLEASQGSDTGGELYDYPGLYTELSHGERYATLLLEERTADHEVVRGTSTCRTLSTGYSFDLTDYYVDEANQKYLVVGVSHSARGGGYRASAPETVYSNQFECAPVSAPYRAPRRTRKPVVLGSQTAVVVGPSGEEIYTDSDGHGRVKIQFHWDRLGENDENSSCWVRVSHPWAGKGWGAVAIPRIGQEVIVDFLEGDPDRPIITGRVYNQDLKPPFSPQDGGVVSGMMSKTHKGSGNNAISMDDTAGQEQLNTTAQYDMNTNVGNNQTLTVAVDRTSDIGSNETASVGSNQSITVGADQTLDVGGNQTITVGADRSVDVGASDTLSVGADRSASIGAANSVSAGTDHSVTAGANIAISSGANTEVAAGANATMSAAANFDIGAGAQIAISAGAMITLTAGGGSISIGPDGVTISGPTVNVLGSGMVNVTGALVKIN